MSFHSEKKNVLYPCLAGAMLGLAWDAKYIAFFLIPAILIYFLWIKGFNLRVFIDKKLFLIGLFALLFFMPLLFGLFYTGVDFHGILYYAIQVFTLRNIVGGRVLSLSIDQLVARGVERLTDIFSWGGLLNYPWVVIFRVCMLLLLIYASIYYIIKFFKKEEKSSFIFISIFFSGILLLFLGKYQHYMIYLFPFYYIMISSVFTGSWFSFKKENSAKNIPRVIIMSFTAIVFIFYILTGATSFQWDRGDYSPWVKDAVDFIKIDSIKSGYEDQQIFTGTVTPKQEIINYYLYPGNFTTVFLIEWNERSKWLSLDGIALLKPTYIIANEAYYEYFFDDKTKREIFKYYYILLYINTYNNGIGCYKCGGYVLKRKDIPSPDLKPNIELSGTETLSNMICREGNISHELFQASVPNLMSVGEVSTALVRVENTGCSRGIFNINVYAGGNVLFIDDHYREITLDKDSTALLEFKMVPYNIHAGKIPVTVDLSVKYENFKFGRKVDSSTDYVSIIDN
jgi:hypothetical protein